MKTQPYFHNFTVLTQILRAYASEISKDLKKELTTFRLSKFKKN
jgi:hypothetical protein